MLNQLGQIDMESTLEFALMLISDATMRIPIGNLNIRIEP